MLKCLVILGFLVIGGGAWSQVPGDRSAQDQKPQGAENRPNQGQPVPARVNAEIPTAEEKKSADPQSSQYPWHELYGPANIPNWFLVIIGAGGIFAAVRTIRVISIQTNLMKEQLDRMVEKERARLNLDAQPISVEGEEGRVYCLSTRIGLTNNGQSKAYITFSAGRFVVVPSGQMLPQPDPDEFFLPHPFSVIEPSEEPVYASFSFDDVPLRFGGFAEGFANGDLTAYLYGFVEYETLGIKRHRDFGYMWTTDAAEQNSAPQSLEEMITDGWWEESLKMRNGEYTANPN